MKILFGLAYIKNNKQVRTLFLSFLLLFVSYYVYETIGVILHNQGVETVIVFTDDFESENQEENNENESDDKEIEDSEIDDFLFSKKRCFAKDQLNNLSLNSNHNRNLFIFLDIPSPPPKFS